MKANENVLVLCNEEDLDELKGEYKSKRVRFEPAIRFEDNDNVVKSALALLDAADYVVFSSKHAVRLIMSHSKSDTIRVLKGRKIFAAGSATKKELEDNGINVVYAPKSGGLESVIDYISSMDRGTIIEITGGSRSTSEQAIANTGFMLVRLKIYSVVQCLDKKGAKLEGIGSIVFPSGAEVKAFESLGIDKERLKGIKAICIGKKALAIAKPLFDDAELSEQNSIGSAISKALG
ncbi:MAG: uroporphyrinogen-III synthase [Candidatus Marsarchaeota archaeon]|nr:uroporphyrinogen-III synthase [Candidatus Marsarchaeota archaeon]